MEIYNQLPTGISRERFTTVSITRALNPNTGQTADILTVNGGSIYQNEVKMMARANGFITTRGFGKIHAEVLGRQAAEARGWVPLVTHSSRPHCEGCTNDLITNSILQGTPR
ncbi:hypothetical protein [Chitinivorax sp. B]|uniref:hypothetical protein n=1 Tax=Chitinivorax sp. B TaxID=2502235 RepID=UPI0010F918C8|nr:hypothetical protein [Chitinivorax sp. B]